MSVVQMAFQSRSMRRPLPRGKVDGAWLSLRLRSWSSEGPKGTLVGNPSGALQLSLGVHVEEAQALGVVPLNLALLHVPHTHQREESCNAELAPLQQPRDGANAAFGVDGVERLEEPVRPPR